MDPEQAHACEEGISVSLPWLVKIQTKEQAIIPELGWAMAGKPMRREVCMLNMHTQPAQVKGVCRS